MKYILLAITAGLMYLSLSQAYNWGVEYASPTTLEECKLRLP